MPLALAVRREDEVGNFAHRPLAAYIGDDVNDLEALRAVGFSAAPADAMPSVLKAVHYVCEKKGGEGAVREVADLILAAHGKG